MENKKIILLLVLFIEAFSALNLQSANQQSFLQKKSTVSAEVKYADRVPATENPPPLPVNFTGLGIADESKVNSVEFMKIWKNYHLSNGDIKQLFEVIDYKHLNFITPSDWGHFYHQFVDDFVTNCDPTTDWLMDQGELTGCIDSPVFTFTEKTTNPDFISNLMLIMFESQQMLNFADYMFLRRANLAWEKCAVEQLLSQSKMECALGVINPNGRRLGLPEASVIFDLALEIKFIKPELQDDPYLTFLNFLEIARIYHFFSYFEIPFQDGILHRNDVERAVRDQIAPYQFTPYVIESLFSAINSDHLEITSNQQQMDLKAFAQAYRYLRIWMKYQQTVQQDYKGVIIVDEFKSVMADPELDPLFESTVSNMLMPELDQMVPDEEEEEEVEVPSGEDDKRGGTVEDFLIQFTQLSAKVNLKSKQTEPPLPPDPADLNAVMFTMFESSHTGLMKFGDMVKFFKYLQLFINYDKLNKGQIGVKELTNGLKSVSNAIPVTAKEMLRMHELIDFMQNKQFKVNLKGFTSWMVFYDAFADLTNPMSPDNVRHDDLVRGLNRMSITLTNVNNVDQSPDNKGKPMFNFKQAFKFMLQEESENITKQYKAKAAAA